MTECGEGVGAPTLAVVSVRLFSVVDLPEEGLPTSAMRGSRGILATLSTAYLRLYAHRRLHSSRRESRPPRWCRDRQVSLQ